MQLADTAAATTGDGVGASDRKEIGELRELTGSVNTCHKPPLGRVLCLDLEWPGKRDEADGAARMEDEDAAYLEGDGKPPLLTSRHAGLAMEGSAGDVIGDEFTNPI